MTGGRLPQGHLDPAAVGALQVPGVAPSFGALVGVEEGERDVRRAAAGELAILRIPALERPGELEDPGAGSAGAGRSPGVLPDSGQAVLGGRVRDVAPAIVLAALRLCRVLVVEVAGGIVATGDALATLRGAWAAVELPVPDIDDAEALVEFGLLGAHVRRGRLVDPEHHGYRGRQGVGGRVVVEVAGHLEEDVDFLAVIGHLERHVDRVEGAKL